MAKQIKGNEIIEDGHLENAIKQGEQLKKVYADLDAQVKKTAKSLKSGLQGVNPNSSADIAKVNAEYKKSATLKTNAIALDKEKLALDNKLIKAKARQDATTKQYREELAKTRLENARLNKEAKQTVELQSKTTGAYRKATIRLVELKRELKDASIAGNKNENSIKELRQEYDKLNKEIRQTDQELGDFQRNVGNYGSVFDGFGEKIQGLGQGLGGAVRGESGGIGGALSSVTSKLGPLGVALAGTVGGLTAVGSAVIEVDKEFDELRGTIAQLTGTTGTDLDALTKSIKALQETFGADTNESLRASNVLMKEFGLSGSEAVALIEQGFLSNANIQGDLLDSITEYSTQIKLAGGDAQDLFKILDASGESGVFSDKGIDTVKEFGLRIREQAGATTDALANAFGGDFTNDLFSRINDGSTTTIDALQEVTDKLKFTNLTASERQTVIADVFGGAGEDAGSFLETLTQINFETAFQADLSGDLAKKKKAELDANKGLADAQNELSKAIGDSSEIGRVWTQILTFIVTELTNAFDRINFVIKGFGLFKDSLYNKFIDPLNDGIKVFNNFTNSLGLGDVIDEFDRATGTLDEFNRKRREQIAISIEATRVIKEGLIEQQNEITGFKDLTKSIGDANVPREQQIAKILEIKEQYPEMLEGYNEENLQNANLVDVKNKLNKEFTEELINRKKNIALRALDNELARRERIISFLKEGDAKNQAIEELNRIRKFGLEKIDLVEQQTRKLLGFEDEIAEKDEENTKKVISNNKKKVDDTKKSEEQIVNIKKISLRKQDELIDDLIVNEKSFNDILLENTIDYLKIRQEITDKENAEYLKQFRDLSNQLGDLLQTGLENAISKIDSQIQKSQDRISTSQDRISNLQEQANLGNLDASESIKAERQRIANESARIEELEKKKRNLLITITALQLAQQGIQNGDGNALITAKDKINEFVDGLSNNYDGTETTLGAKLGNKNRIYGDKDTHVIKAHEDEVILGVNNSRKLKGMNQTEITKGALLYKNGELVGNKAVRIQKQSIASVDNRMLDKLDSVENAIKKIDIPQHTFNWQDAIHSIKTKKSITNNHYKKGGVFS